MIVERRQILFSPGALREAVRLYGELPQQQDLPYGVIAAVSVSTEAEPALNVHVQQSGANRTKQVQLAGSKVMAALILLCRKWHVPLPRNANKAFAVEGVNLVLTLSCSVRTAGE